MAVVRPLPPTGSMFFDTRGGGRVLRVSWHQEADVVVLSLWRDNLCTGSFRLTIDEVPVLIETLRSGLDAAYDDATRRAERVDGLRSRASG
ncbi:hypothetical protein [Nocardioides solisilvae]|uniref:hypothetical protein n=1 Tax=Nocardioides solisilvae TaxID=1542435 RepID=UPI000D741370|nr:hypothetical protein [Nocardioides solisilvae]